MGMNLSLCQTNAAECHSSSETNILISEHAARAKRTGWESQWPGGCVNYGLGGKNNAMRMKHGLTENMTEVRADELLTIR
jgi:hypothetical protein